jgi:HAD superfamily hydrolase (TIGR01549 family)
MTRVVLFDLDNTLVDRQGAFRRWAESFAARRGLGPDAAAWLCAADRDGFAARDDLFAAARRHLGLDEDVPALVAQYRAEYFDHFAPDPDVLAAVGRLRDAGWRTGIVTNGPVTQREKIVRSGLVPLMDGLCISDEVGVEKPDPGIFEEAIRRCSGGAVLDGPAWMVGDTPDADIAGGRAAGLRTAWLRRGRNWPEPAFRPDVVASDLYQVVDLVVGGPPA